MGDQALGTRSVPEYDVGQSGQAERMLTQVSPAQYNGSPEKVLIQAKAPGATFAADPAMRQAASQVAAALAAPALGLRLGQPAIDAPKNVGAVSTMDAAQRAFPQAPAPAEIVVTGRAAVRTVPRVTATVGELRARVEAGGPVRPQPAVRGVLLPAALALLGDRAWRRRRGVLAGPAVPADPAFGDVPGSGRVLGGLER